MIKRMTEEEFAQAEIADAAMTAAQEEQDAADDEELARNLQPITDEELAEIDANFSVIS